MKAQIVFVKIRYYIKNFISDGAGFMCPKDRSTVMFFQCGEKNKLKYVQELSPCTYKFVVDVQCVSTKLFYSWVFII